MVDEISPKTYNFIIELVLSNPPITEIIKTGKHVAIVKTIDEDIGEEYMVCWYHPKRNELCNYYLQVSEELDREILGIIRNQSFDDVTVDSSSNQELYDYIAKKVRQIKRSYKGESDLSTQAKLFRLESKIIAVEQLLLHVVDVLNKKERIVIKRREVTNNSFANNKITPL